MKFLEASAVENHFVGMSTEPRLGSDQSRSIYSSISSSDSGESRAFSYAVNGTCYVFVPLACNHHSIFFSFSVMAPFFDAFRSGYIPSLILARRNNNSYGPWKHCIHSSALFSFLALFRLWLQGTLWISTCLSPLSNHMIDIFSVSLLAFALLEENFILHSQ